MIMVEELIVVRKMTVVFCMTFWPHTVYVGVCLKVVKEEYVLAIDAMSSLVFHASSNIKIHSHHVWS